MEMVHSKDLMEAQAHVWNHTLNYISSMALTCAIQLGIPDVISDHDGPVTLSELASQLSIPQTKSNQLHRLMRLLVHNGFFAVKKDEEGRVGYVHTYSSKVLSNKQQGNLAPAVLLFAHPMFVTPCFSIADWFRGTDPTPFEAVHGTYLYDHLRKHSDLSKIFSVGMANHSDWILNPLLKDLKPMLEGCESLVDVAGGTGNVAKALSEAVPNLKCTVYDLPHVISEIKDLDNITLVAGDMFEFVPSAGVILFKDILVDWTDEECVKILKRCREAISRGTSAGKVIIVNTVHRVNKADSESVKAADLLVDVFLLTCVIADERSETEWKKIFIDAGFTSYKITSTMDLNSIIEVFP